MTADLEGEVTALIADETCIPLARIHGESRLLQDLGIDGDDGTELLTAFATRFGVDLEGFHPGRHFGPEGLWPWFLFSWAIAWLRGVPLDSGLIPIRVRDLVQAAHTRRLRSADLSERDPPA